MVMSHRTGRFWVHTQPQDPLCLPVLPSIWYPTNAHFFKEDYLSGIFPLGGKYKNKNKKNFLHSRLIKCSQNSKGKKSLLHPWLGFSFMEDNLDRRGVCWLPSLWGQAAGSEFSEKSSRWPLESTRSQPRFPWRITEWLLQAHSPLGPNQVQYSFRVLKPSICESYMPQKTMVPPINEERILLPKGSLVHVWRHNVLLLLDQALSQVLILVQLT